MRTRVAEAVATAKRCRPRSKRGASRRVVEVETAPERPDTSALVGEVGLGLVAVLDRDLLGLVLQLLVPGLDLVLARGGALDLVCLVFLGDSDRLLVKNADVGL